MRKKKKRREREEEGEWTGERDGRHKVSQASGISRIVKQEESYIEFVYFRSTAILWKTQLVWGSDISRVCVCVCVAAGKLTG